MTYKNNIFLELAGQITQVLGLGLHVHNLILDNVVHQVSGCTWVVKNKLTSLQAGLVCYRSVFYVFGQSGRLRSVYSANSKSFQLWAIAQERRMTYK
jgi:hypothetical protein